MRSNGTIKGIVCRARGFVLLLGAAAFLGSCAQRHTLSREEFRSDLTSAISVANETEMSIDFVARGQATRSFAVGHLHSLLRQLRDIEKQIAHPTPERGLEQSVDGSRAQMDALSTVLTAIASDTRQADALAVAKERVHAIRAALEHEESSL